MTLSSTPNYRRAESESVKRILVAMIREAEEDADMVVAFLRAHGLKPRRREKSSVAATAIPTGPAADFLLELSAALRLRVWEQAGIMPLLREKFPSADQAVADAANRFVASDRDSQRAQELPMAVFRTSYQQISRAAQMELNTPMVLPSTWDMNNLLDELADLLWENRNLSEHPTKRKEQNHESSPNK